MFQSNLTCNKTKFNNNAVKGQSVIKSYYVGGVYAQYSGQIKGNSALTIATEWTKDAFTKALFVAIPSARQATQSGASSWDFAKIFIRTGQRLQVSFEEPIRKESEGGYLKPSIKALIKNLSEKETMIGSLFGKKKEFTWGQDENFSIDHLCDGVSDYLNSVEVSNE